MSFTLNPRAALILFTSMVLFMLAQATWWIIFMAHLVDEKVELARQFGAGELAVELIRQEEHTRQIMIGMEGSFFLLLILIFFWIIYQSFKKSQELKFHQQNFLMAVTHELKTPLTSINIYLDNLKSPRVSTEKKEEILINIKDDIRRLNGLVENILSAGRFDRADFRLSRDEFNFSKFLIERVEYLKKTPMSSFIEITSDIEDGIEAVGDRESLARAIDAVLENARKYADSKKPQIAVELKSQGRHLVLKISDNGPGIPKKELNRIFERFYRVGDEMTRRVSGTGLGLYLCREVIKANGGRITAHSDNNRPGTTFIIKLKRQMV